MDPDHSTQVPRVDNYQNAQEGMWPNGPVHLARGRQAKDPNVKTVSYTVASLDEFETSLRQYLNDPPDLPENTECQLSFWIGASFLVIPPVPSGASHQRRHQQQQPQQQQHQSSRQEQQASSAQAPPGYRPANGLHTSYNTSSDVASGFQPSRQHVSVSDPSITLTLPAVPAAPAHENNDDNNNTNGRITMSIPEALADTPDPKDKMRKQRAIAKCCVDSIQKVDGYRYSFHNCWNSREDDAFRFSYYCNDSLLNKDRAANGKGAKLGKRATKPVFDCKGVLSVKFSATKQTLDIFYKHIPIHKTYEERAPPPRKDSKRRKYLEENDPEAMANRPKPRNRDSEDGASASPDPDAPPKQKRPRKRRETGPKNPANSIESDLRTQSLRSLLELIQTDPAAPEPSTTTAVEEPQTPEASHQKRKKSNNSCDVCKVKKTKCDGGRPFCQTCIKRNVPCVYSAPMETGGQAGSSNAHPQAQEPAQPAAQDAARHAEVEELRKQLEEARSQIAALQAEKAQVAIATEAASPPPVPVPAPVAASPQRPQRTPVPPPQQRPAAQRQIQTPQSQTQQRQIQAPQPQAQQRPIQTPQQQTPQPHIQTQQQIPAPQQQIPNQYSHFSNHASLPSYSVNRSVQSSSTTIRPPAAVNHLQSASLATAADTTDPYARDYRRSNAPNAYNYYPSGTGLHQPTPQDQQDSWNSSWNPNVYR